ncbi:hypothetical protein JCM1841_006791 [Sporobolomyces salmonicolor]
MTADAVDAPSEPKSSIDLDTPAAHSSRKSRLLKRSKQAALDFVGYDPQVVEAASVTNTLREATQGSFFGAVGNYIRRLFPFTSWIFHYNLRWGISDLIAGITVGLVLVPQSMSYAKIATLSPEYGLYSSFVGVVIYAFFASSKDVSIGPVAVMSLEVARVIQHVQSQPGGEAYPAPVIATAIAFLCGIIVLGIGLLRLGWIIEFIPTPSIAGFTTGSALNIAAGQVPSLMGYSNKLNTRRATYHVIIDSLKHLPDTQLDAAYGLSGLVFLYVVRYALRQVEARARNPIIKRIAFFCMTLRTAFVIIFLTVFAWVHLRGRPSSEYDISILKDVPSGFRHMGQPALPTKLLSLLGPELPVSTIILLLEHIAIAKSFGRVNNYKIDANQELIAIGVSNLVGTVFNAYPATGSFSRSAINAKAGVRTPLGGWVTGICVVVALYALTGAFYWIPNAALSAVIIHAVLDLIASPKQAYAFWKVSPLEAGIFVLAVLVSVFSTMEIGIYVSVGASVALLLFRIARPRGAFLGRVRLRPDLENPNSNGPTRDVYVPLTPDGVRNPLVRVEPPPPGVIVFRFEESFLYPNASFYADIVLDYAQGHTRSGQRLDEIPKGDRPWNNPGPLPWKKKKTLSSDEAQVEKEKPLLRAVVFDFSGVSHVDTTSLQNLVDLKRSLERYVGDHVEFHFASILSPYIKRALLAGGFGTGKGWIGDERPLEIAPVVNEGMQPVLTEHARRLQRSHFQRRYPRSPGPSSPPNGLVSPRSPSPGGSGSTTEVELDSDRDREEGDRKNQPELEERDLEAALDAAQREQELAVPGVHVGGHVWADQVPGHNGAHDEAPVVSHLFPRFHLDLSSAVAAAVGKDDW